MSDVIGRIFPVNVLLVMVFLFLIIMTLCILMMRRMRQMMNQKGRNNGQEMCTGWMQKTGEPTGWRSWCCSPEKRRNPAREDDS